MQAESLLVVRTQTRRFDRRDDPTYLLLVDYVTVDLVGRYVVTFDRKGGLQYWIGKILRHHQALITYIHLDNDVDLFRILIDGIGADKHFAVAANILHLILNLFNDFLNRGSGLYSDTGCFKCGMIGHIFH